jgi:hypothetical protein
MEAGRCERTQRPGGTGNLTHRALAAGGGAGVTLALWEAKIV